MTTEKEIQEEAYRLRKPIPVKTKLPDGSTVTIYRPAGSEIHYVRMRTEKEIEKDIQEEAYRLGKPIPVKTKLPDGSTVTIYRPNTRPHGIKPENDFGNSGEDFEKYLGKYYHERGYAVEYTSKTNDKGADLILRKGEERTVVQAKRYKGSVGVSAVQEVVAAKGYYGADHGKVVTTGRFTKSARLLARANNIEMEEM